MSFVGRKRSQRSNAGSLGNGERSSGSRVLRLADWSRLSPSRAIYLKLRSSRISNDYDNLLPKKRHSSATPQTPTNKLTDQPAAANCRTVRARAFKTPQHHTDVFTNANPCTRFSETRKRLSETPPVEFIFFWTSWAAAPSSNDTFLHQ